MSGIAGIAARGKRAQLEQMLASIKHRGPAGKDIIETDCATLGLVWTHPQAEAATILQKEQRACDSAGLGHFAEASVRSGQLTLMRDPLGVTPLYYGRTSDGHLCFASEVKALLQLTPNAYELLPGHHCDSGRIVSHFRLGSV